MFHPLCVGAKVYVMPKGAFRHILPILFLVQVINHPNKVYLSTNENTSESATLSAKRRAQIIENEMTRKINLILPLRYGLNSLSHEHKKRPHEGGCTSWRMTASAI